MDRLSMLYQSLFLLKNDTAHRVSVPKAHTANRRQSAYIRLMMVHRLRRWPDIKPT